MGSSTVTDAGDSRDPFVALRTWFAHWPPVLLTMVAVGCATLMRVLLDRVWPDEFRFLPFHAAIAVCAVVAGWRYATLATLLSVVLIVPLTGGPIDLAIGTGLAMFLLLNAIIVAFVNAGRRARFRAEAAAAQARERERRFSVMADNLPLLVWVHDVDGRLLFVNKAWEQFTGLSLAEARRGAWGDLLLDEDRAAHTAAFLDCLRRKQPFVAKVRVRRADGSWRILQTHGVPRLGEHGELLAYAGTSYDITEQEALEAERKVLLESERAARTDAELATRAKDEFLATLSHELRTPLSVIVLWSRILARKYESTGEDLGKGLALIIDNGMALSQLIGDLLDMSRIVSGRVTLDMHPIDAAELVAQAVASHRPAADARHVTVSLDVGPQPKFVLADPTRLQQVLWNLLANALKFTPPNGHVRVTARHSGENLEITVSDDGEGIAPEFLTQVFSRFKQADGTSARRHGGLGLGLAIVKQLVELQGGTVTATSEGLGKGATFTVTLPLHESALASVGTRSTGTWRRLDPDRLLNQRLDGLRILAVEDQVDMLESLRTVLGEHGAEVTPLTSGAAACELLRERAECFDVLMSDLGMPGMDGYDLIRRVRSELGLGPERLFAVALTAYARDEDRSRALQAGFQAHVAKPWHAGQLIAVLNQRLEASRARGLAGEARRETGATLAI